MSCVTCHDPHHDADRSATHYESKCLACHTSAPDPGSNLRRNTPALIEGVRRVSCPVNPSGGCLNCHMPSTNSAVPHTTFADHHIRVHPSPSPEQ
jgi:hypothetical protein